VKKKNLVTLLAIAFMVALVATGMFYGLFVTKLKSNAGGKTLIVAAKPLEAGTVLAADDVKSISWSSDELPAGSYQRPEQVTELNARLIAERDAVVKTVAEIHFVQIELENLVLRVTTLDPLRQNQFLQLAPDGLLWLQKTQPCKLLGDGARALGRAAVPEIGRRRGEDAQPIVSGVIVKPLILDRQDRVDQLGRHLRQRRVDTLLGEDAECQVIAIVEHSGRLVHLADAPEGRLVRQASPEADDVRRGGD